MPTLSPTSNPLSPFASMTGDHVGFRVPDSDQALAWYRDKLDLRVVGSSEVNGLTITLMALANDDDFRLELLGGPGAVERPVTSDDLPGGLSLDGFNHVCLRVGSVKETVAELQRRDVRILLEPFDNTDLQIRVAFFADPWGNVFELLGPLYS